MWQTIVSFLNSLIQGLADVLQFILALLPPSPFALIDNTPVQPYLDSLNYFIPISEMIAIGEAWLAAITLFYGYQIVLRWIKAVE